MRALDLSDRRIVVDGDACPVKAEIAAAASEFHMQVVLVSSYDHRLNGGSGITVVTVDRSSQSADLYIANHIRRGDVVATNDYGLAALALAKGCSVISFRGALYSDDSIDFMLDRRHVSAKERRRGRYGKGPKALTEEDRITFQHKLTKLLTDLQENALK
ncbi:YaiI/YqxD family protein [Paenibacillus sp. P96]|uniref:UPF0178 protein OIN60_09350 n=1 Tax=Paenibacillus zeirhizosphaerae TaxID=2987519 RepID=A0ABT9FQH1_9BACL|nr:YaiI/YqxD family protein [Paenibacillus sp. P96]MDP4096974.1 YaiI/YqxD family protein [Paenibacillus sp. P96]